MTKALISTHLVKRLTCSLLWLTITLTFTQVTAQVPHPPFSKTLPPADTARMAWLHQNGVPVTSGRVTGWFPKDSLSIPQMQAHMDTISRGIRAVEQYIGAPLPWQKLKSGQPIYFYFSPERFIAHASQEGTTFVSFRLIKQAGAPWLHEACHELLATANDTLFRGAEGIPQWLIEGSADFLAHQVSFDQKLYRFDLFRSGGIQGVDQACLRLLKSDKAAYILSSIGSPGIVSELFGNNRFAYAPAFYNCSCSLTKYLVKQHGIASLMAVMGAYPDEQQKLRAITGQSPDVLRTRWLQAINVPTNASEKTAIRSDSLTRLLKEANRLAARIPISTWFRNNLDQLGTEAAVKRFNTLRRADSTQFRYAESYLNRLGYQLLDQQKIKQAIAIFNLNTELYPQSGNVYDSLAEAYLKDGQPTLARKYYQKTLELDPGNVNARAMLKAIEK